MNRRYLPILALAAPVSARATDFHTLSTEAITEYRSWSGTGIGASMTGVELAKDSSSDSDDDVDQTAQPASFTVTTTHVPSASTVSSSILYWGGSQNQSGAVCAVDSSVPDTTITFTTADSVAHTVAADDCYCSDAGAPTSYDEWLCRADVTAFVSGTPRGTYTIDDFGGWSFGSQKNAGAALVFVYSDATVTENRKISLLDGIWTGTAASNVSHATAMTGVLLPAAPKGQLTFFGLGGKGSNDVSSGGVLQVKGTNATSYNVFDANNPANNILNSTVNTQGRTAYTYGQADIDAFTLDGDNVAGLKAGDTSIAITHRSTSGGDKYWALVDLVQVATNGVVLSSSTKTASMTDDNDSNGVLTPGDEVTFVIRVSNNGSSAATVDVTDTIPAQAASWALQDTGNGTNASTATQLIVNDVPVAAGSFKEVSFTIIVGNVTDGTILDNTALLTDSSGVTASPNSNDLTIRRDQDGDNDYDSTDCADNDATRYTGATEVCNGVDDDCDGSVDESGSSGTTTYYRDVDGDGFGLTNTTTIACSAPSGYVATPGDCNDSVASVYPGATEQCNSIDDDCDGQTDEAGATGSSTYYGDVDNDNFGRSSVTIVACSEPNGYAAVAGDCDDADATEYPGATERCDGDDDDCDGQTDESGATGETRWYADSDTDSYGNPGSSTLACNAPSGSVSNSTDCNDSLASVHPGATETCNSIDDDCDGATDEAGSTGSTTFYRDVDADGYGLTSTTTAACSVPSGYAAASGDCNDSVATIHPNAIESCNSVDDDCDGSIDEAGATGGSTYYRDADADGYGNLAVNQSACTQPSGYINNSSDCDDGSAATHPGATEVCDGLDNDCDGTADEGATGLGNWWPDTDADGYGSSSAVPTAACSQPVGYVNNALDCNDASGSVHPGAAEVCNSADDDCDGAIDDSPTTGPTYYADTDADGYGRTSSTIIACSQPSGYSGVSGDCNDANGNIHPNAPESCDGIDEDCDGTIDDNATDAIDFYRDADADNYGVSSVTQAACTVPSGYAAAAGDCNDSVAGIHPNAPEICDGLDQDCDGSADDNATDATPFYGDGDADGYGAPSDVTYACSTPSGYVGTGGDCDDADALVHPGATETCDGTDENCDGFIDVGAQGASTWYRDADADGWGAAANTTAACTQPSGYVDNSQDCDDSDDDVKPGGVEVCNSEDDDCDGVVDDGASGSVTFYGDQDADGFGTSDTTTTACSQPFGYASASGDCDDLVASVYPGAIETCDSRDNDCDGAIDENVAGAPNWYFDYDRDGHGDPGQVQAACSAPLSYVADDDDCDDTDDTVYLDAPELCDGIDNDCDLYIDEDSVGVGQWYADTDADGYGDPNAPPIGACGQPPGYINNDDDCDDTDASINPVADEICNGVDDDCDALYDEDAIDATAWYVDNDNDGYGNRNTPLVTCTPQSGRITTGGDCDDARPQVNPGATEFCNSRDDDCDDVIDEGDASGAPSWYLDADADNYGVTSTLLTACTRPSGYAGLSGDCDDTRNGVYPGATELCNGRDDDCDGSTDELGANGGTRWYADTDTDGHGDASTGVEACVQPSGYVASSDDCDDDDPTIHGGAAEIPYDGIDQDCLNGDLVDVDRDGSTGWIAGGPDCNDNDAAVRPGATEAQNGVDDDCDGTVDEGTRAVDDDGDGFAEAGGDCDDGDATISPVGVEVCDGLDQDCDGVDDDGTECRDDDGDGYSEDAGDCADADPRLDPGNTEIMGNGIDDDCDGSVDGGVADVDGDGYTEDGGDCDPTDASVYPGAPETGDGVDDDCDGEIDENTDSFDDDGDGWTEAFGDCDDSDAAINTDAPEVDNGVDDDCDGQVDEGGDQYDDDLDGYTEDGGDCDDFDEDVGPQADEVSGNGADDDCDGLVDEGDTDLDGDGVTTEGGDCNDSNGWISPNLPELCGDGLDNDCDSLSDENCEGSGVVDSDDTDASSGGGCGSKNAGFLLVPLLVAAFGRRVRRQARV